MASTIVDPEVWEIAAELVRRLGEEAAEHATRCYRERANAGDIIGTETWLQVAHAVEELLRKRGEGEPLN